MASRRSVSSTEREWERAYLANYQHLVRIAALLVGSAAEGEELVQDLWLRLNAATNTPRDPASAIPFFRRSLVNAARDRYRHRRIINGYLARLAPQPSDYDPMEQLFTRTQIVKDLRKLAPRVREALVLRYFADLTIADTASAMGVSAGAIKSYCAEGLRRLSGMRENDDDT